MPAELFDSIEWVPAFVALDGIAVTSSTFPRGPTCMPPAPPDTLLLFLKLGIEGPAPATCLNLADVSGGFWGPAPADAWDELTSALALVPLLWLPRLTKLLLEGRFWLWRDEVALIYDNIAFCIFIVSTCYPCTAIWFPPAPFGSMTRLKALILCFCMGWLPRYWLVCEVVAPFWPLGIVTELCWDWDCEDVLIRAADCRCWNSVLLRAKFCPLLRAPKMLSFSTLRATYGAFWPEPDLSFRLGCWPWYWT